MYIAIVFVKESYSMIVAKCSNVTGKISNLSNIQYRWRMNNKKVYLCYSFGHNTGSNIHKFDTNEQAQPDSCCQSITLLVSTNSFSRYEGYY